MIGKLSTGRELCFAFDQRKRHALELRDRAAKRLAFLNIGPGFVDRRLRRGDALKRDQRAAVVKPGHHFGKTAALAAETMVQWNRHGVEEDRAATAHRASDIPKPGFLDTRRFRRNEKSGDALWPIAFGPGPREHE